MVFLCHNFFGTDDVVCRWQYVSAACELADLLIGLYQIEPTADDDDFGGGAEVVSEWTLGARLSDPAAIIRPLERRSGRKGPVDESAAWSLAVSPSGGTTAGRCCRCEEAAGEEARGEPSMDLGAVSCCVARFRRLVLNVLESIVCHHGGVGSETIPLDEFVLEFALGRWNASNTSV